MIKQFILLLILSLGFTQDEYPYFSDLKKQLEFEEKKVYITEVKEKEMILSGGGSEFNYLSLLNPWLPYYSQEPLYLESDINTNYIYKYKFEITQNNKILDEINFLYRIGLDEEADAIIDNYNNSDEVKNYNKLLSLYNEDYEKYLKTESVNKERLDILRKKQKKTLNRLLISSLITVVFIQADYNDIVAMNIAGVSGVYATIQYYIWIFRNTGLKSSSIKKPPPPQKPPIKQTLSSKQLKSLAESYNRKLYKQLTND